MLLRKFFTLELIFILAFLFLVGVVFVILRQTEIKSDDYSKELTEIEVCDEILYYKYRARINELCYIEDKSLGEYPLRHREVIKQWKKANKP